MNSKIVRAFGCLIVMALALGLTACGDDGGGGGAASGPDPDRYCELVEVLEKAGSEAFDEVESDENATDEDFAAASKAFTESVKDEFDELIKVAPADISDDVKTLIASIRGRAGLGDEVDDKEASAAEERITAWEEENC